MIQSNFNKLITFFDAAATHLKHPKLVIKLELDKVVIARAPEGGRSRYPGCIHISDGGGFANNRYYGRINRDGTALWRMDTPDQLKQFVSIINENPVEAAKLQGLAYGHCMFCGLELTDKRSVFVGYGPTCAEKWNLPWGETPKKDTPIADQLDLGL